MKDSKHLLQHVQDFFIDHLRAHRGLSPHTITSYRDTLKLFLIYVAKRMDKQSTQLLLDDLQAEKVLSFLDDVESVRKNSVMTRNIRLAALRTFFRYLASQDPLRAGQYQRVVAIPLKRGARPAIEYLEINEVKAILETIDRNTTEGRRDYALISFLYNTGSRVQEVADIRVENLRLATPPIAIITGKGRKTRHVPLWAETASLLQVQINERGIIEKPQAHLFVNARGEPLSRFGIRYIIRSRVKAASQQCISLQSKRISPHTFRHYVPFLTMSRKTCP